MCFGKRVRTGGSVGAVIFIKATKKRSWIEFLPPKGQYLVRIRGGVLFTWQLEKKCIWFFLAWSKAVSVCSQFGNQLITDFGQFFDLLILWEKRSTLKSFILLSSGTSRLDMGRKNVQRPERDFQTGPAAYRMSADVLFFITGSFHTFCWTALSRESTFICSFLRLAPSATPSEVALVLTWAISSLALRRTRDRRRDTWDRWSDIIRERGNCLTQHSIKSTS